MIQAGDAGRGHGHPVRAVARAGPAGLSLPGGAGADPAVRVRVGRDELPGGRRRLPRSVIVFIAAPVFAAIITDRVSRSSAGMRSGITRSPRGVAWPCRAGRAEITGMLALYGCGPCSRRGRPLKGVRRMVLDAAPLPGG